MQRVSRGQSSAKAAACVVLLMAIAAEAAVTKPVLVGTPTAPVFVPAVTTIHVGDSIHFVMGSKLGPGHNVLFLSAPPGVNKAALSHVAPLWTVKGQSYKVQFTKPGTYVYECTVHAAAGMKGMIRVIKAAGR